MLQALIRKFTLFRPTTSSSMAKLEAYDSGKKPAGALKFHRKTIVAKEHLLHLYESCWHLSTAKKVPHEDASSDLKLP